jgi:hypothetical protein
MADGAMRLVHKIVLTMAVHGCPFVLAVAGDPWI